MTESRRLLRHFLAALAYRTQKALRGAPAGFAEIRLAPTSRSPRELLWHMAGLMGYARTQFHGGSYRPEALPSFEAEVARFHEQLALLGADLADPALECRITDAQLLQGPLADAMTHAGQLAMLRRLAGDPVPSENFISAKIDPTNLGPNQPAPAAPDAWWTAEQGNRPPGMVSLPASSGTQVAMASITLAPVDLDLHATTLARWFARPHITAWWGDPAHALEHARECAPESHALIVADGVPVGYLCWHAPPRDEFEAAGLSDLPRGLVDIDILIGEVPLLGQGIGSRALALLLTRLEGEPGITMAGLGVSMANHAALRCFDKAGFRPYRDFGDPVWGECRYLVASVKGAT